jgi:hypothetical protein
MMSNHMHGAANGFHMFDNKTGVLAYSDFCSLITALYKAAFKEPPTYQVMKDIYDSIDVRRDGRIDYNEWRSAFRIQTAVKVSEEE